MKNINEMYDNKKNKKAVYLELKKNFLLATKDEYFIKLCNSIDTTEDILMKYTSNLEKTVRELKNCEGCKGLGQCNNLVLGYVSYPKLNEETIIFSYKPCKYKKELDENVVNVTYFEMPLVLKEAKMKNIFTDDKNRIEAIKYATLFIKNFKKDKKLKAMYLHGSFGSGKSYIISALINELSKKDVDGIIVYYPNLLKKLKDSFKENNHSEILENIMKTDILLLDDIGAENNTSWARDEILGTILQHRMDNNLSTFFTSNLTIEELESHLKSTKDGADSVKARRIIERIKYLTKDIELVSENKRN